MPNGLPEAITLSFPGGPLRMQTSVFVFYVYARLQAAARGGPAGGGAGVPERDGGDTKVRTAPAAVAPPGRAGRGASAHPTAAR
eukprot:3854485-Pyramimonas_sp.AAC.1